MRDLMTKVLETQMMTIALIMPRGQETRIIQNLQGTTTTSFYRQSSQEETKML